MPVVIFYILQWLQGVMSACRGLDEGREMDANGIELVVGWTARMSR